MVPKTGDDIIINKCCRDYRDIVAKGLSLYLLGGVNCGNVYATMIFHVYGSKYCCVIAIICNLKSLTRKIPFLKKS